MAVIHISEAEAALDLHALIAQVRAGAEVVIEADNEPVAVLRTPTWTPKHRSIGEAIRLAEARGSNVTLDDKFGDDMEEIMRFNRQGGWPNDWESY